MLSFVLAVISESFFLEVCLITLTCLTSSKSLGPDPGSTRVFPLIKTQTWQRRGRHHGTSFHWETNWGTGELCTTVHWKGTGHQDTLFPPTPTWALQAFLFPVKWGQAFPGCSWQERSCNPGSQLRVQVRSFWAVSGLTPVQWILAHEKKASTSAFSSPYPNLFEQSSPCPTAG